MNYKRFILAAIMASPLLAASQSHAVTRVDLGAAGNFTILAKTGISSTGTTVIDGDIGVSPAAATSITGFGLILDASGTFATSSLVIGKAFAADFTAPTPANLTTAVSDMQTAFTDAAGRAAGVTELGAGNIGGMTLAPGVYKWGTGVTIPTDVTLSGGANAVWIFQIAGTLTVSSATKVHLIGGAQPKNIFWQVADQTTLGTTSEFKGVILDQTAIVMNTGAKLDGRALAQSAVTLQSNAVNSQPIPNLVDNTFAIASSKDPSNNICEVGAVGAAFTVSGDIFGVGTASQAVRISYNAPRPTSASRSSSKVSVKQGSFSTLRVTLDAENITGDVPIEKCSVTGSVTTSKMTGSVSTNCSGSNLFGGLTANQAASVQAAFNGSKTVTFKVNNTGKWSLKIKCSGDASIGD